MHTLILMIYINNLRPTAIKIFLQQFCSKLKQKINTTLKNETVYLKRIFN